PASVRVDDARRRGGREPAGPVVRSRPRAAGGPFARGACRRPLPLGGGGDPERADASAPRPAPRRARGAPAAQAGRPRALPDRRPGAAARPRRLGGAPAPQLTQDQVAVAELGPAVSGLQRLGVAAPEE